MITDAASALYRVDTENPWPGLAWFDESAAAFFNGRRREIAALKRLVVDSPLTVLFGRSGLGKTSLLKAGLFPAIRDARFLPVYLRFDFTSPGVGDAPLIEQLYAVFMGACRSVGADAPGRAQGETFWEYVHRTDFKVWSAQNELLVPLFVIDQFEEVFTLGATKPAGVMRLREDLADLAENRIPVATEGRLAADETVAARLALRGIRYRVLLSFREDFATTFERWQELPSLMRNRLQLLPMSGPQAFEAVFGSASHLMDADTAEQIVRFVASERQAAEASTPLDDLVVEPALLSLVCRGLNDSRQARRDRGGPNRIDRDLLASTGAGVVDSHYDACMGDQPERVHRFVESELITESGFRKPCAQDDALREPYRVALDSLRVLVDRRLLRIEPSLGVTRVELIHDLLTPTVVARRDARRSADRKRAVEEELREQEAARQAIETERQTRRRMRVIATVAAVAVIITLALGALAVYAMEQARIAQAEGERAAAQARLARSRELASAAITRLDLDPELAVRLALEAAKIAPTAQAESALRQSLFRWPGRGVTPSPESAGALPLRELKGHGEDVMSVAFSPDGTKLLSASCDKTARVWNVATGSELLVLRDHRASLSVGVFSRNGRAVATAGGNPCITIAQKKDPNDTDVRVWDAATGQVIARLAGAPSLLVGAALSADQSEVAAGGIDGQLRIWTIATGEMRVLGGHTAGIQSIEYSPDGTQLASGGLDGRVLIRDARSGEPVAELKHATGVLAIAYGGIAGQSVSLASVDLNGIAKVWDASSFALRRELNSYDNALNATAFSRDSRFLIAGGRDLLIWETETGARLQTLAKRGGLYAASMSPDGRMIAVGGNNGFLALLECDVCVPLDGLINLATARSPRELTQQERKDFFETES